MDFVQKKVTGQQGMTGRRGPRGPLSWILASVPESGVKGQLARPFPMQVAGPCMALQTWGKLTTRPDVSGHFTDPQGSPPQVTRIYFPDWLAWCPAAWIQFH